MESYEESCKYQKRYLTICEQINDDKKDKEMDAHGALSKCFMRMN